jgi:oxygen-dependent protoporphyrinogen oxidase
MPQYALGHIERVARIEQLTAQVPGLELAGNAYHGVGVPDCIHSGEMAAERVFRNLGEVAKSQA